jgi:hypothetical protein
MAGRDFDERDEDDNLDEFGNRLNSVAECVVCGTETRLRCSPCGAVLCNACPVCPNGCDA